MHRAGKEARIQQVQNRMFDAADILINVHPIVGLGQIGGRCRMWCGKAGVIPRAVHEGVHGVGLAPRRGTAGRAGAIAPGRVTVQRVAGNVKGDIIGQLDRQVFFLFGHHAASIAMDHRNRATPIALTRDAPVAQAVVGDTATDATGLASLDRGKNCLFAGLHFGACKAADILDAFGFHRNKGFGQGCGRACLGHKDRRNRQAVFAGEFKVALIMRGATKDRPSAVIHQHKVGDIDRQLPIVVKGMHHSDAGIHADFLGGFHCLGGGAALAAFSKEGGNGGVVAFQMLGKRMIGADRGKACAHQRVGAGGIDLDPVKAFGRAMGAKGKLQAARFADPIGLHQAHLVGPIGQTVQRIQQFAGIIADLKEPLRQLATFHRRVRPPAFAVDHLFVGQNRHINRIPVHHRGFAVDQTSGHHVDEHRLLLAVVFRITGGEFAAPVNRQAQRLHLRAHVGDIAVGPILGVAAAFHRRVLGWHAKGVPAHWVQHRKPLRGLIARHHIAHGIVAHMAHMNAPRGIGEHFQDIILGLGRIMAGSKDAGVIPSGLPFRFDGFRVVARHDRPHKAIAWRKYTAKPAKV